MNSNRPTPEFLNSEILEHQVCMQGFQSLQRKKSGHIQRRKNHKHEYFCFLLFFVFISHSGYLNIMKQCHGSSGRIIFNPEPYIQKLYQMSQHNFF